MLFLYIFSLSLGTHYVCMSVAILGLRKDTNKDIANNGLEEKEIKRQAI